MTDYAVARHNMVESQIRPNRVTDDAVIAAFEAVPREQFVPTDRRGFAYIDEDLRIARGRYLMEPMVFARLVQAAELGPDDLVLDIGCGTGYSSAVLAKLCGTVVAVERDPALAEIAGKHFTELGIDNAVVVEGGFAEGHPKQAPYNAIFFQAAVAEAPPAVLDQLADGGRVLLVQRPASGIGQARRYTKFGDVVSAIPLFDAATSYLPGMAPAERFEF
jgi:protein-L-isoaspartate(D-aspartate) O-methyltransferase